MVLSNLITWLNGRPSRQTNPAEKAPPSGRPGVENARKAEKCPPVDNLPHHGRVTIQCVNQNNDAGRPKERGLPRFRTFRKAPSLDKLVVEVIPMGLVSSGRYLDRGHSFEFKKNKPQDGGSGRSCFQGVTATDKFNKPPPPSIALRTAVRGNDNPVRWQAGNDKR